MTSRYDTLVIGGGQAGLAAAHYLEKAGLSYIILEASGEFGGSWRHFYKSLELFTPAGLSALPGKPFPGDPERFPHAHEVDAYLKRYAAALDPPVVLGARVERVEQRNGAFVAHAGDGSSYDGRTVVAATGSFGRPFVPELPGRDAFRGRLMHSNEYFEPAPFEGRRVVVIGAASSAVQIACDLEPVAHVVLASRKHVIFMPLRTLGKSFIFWSRVSGFDFLPIREQSVVLDDGRFKSYFTSGRIRRRPMFERFTEEGVRWADGTAERFDVAIFGTGFRPNVLYLRVLPGALDSKGEPLHRCGVSRNVEGLYYLSLQAQRTFASPALRGVGPDAAFIVERIRRRIEAGAG